MKSKNAIFYKKKLGNVIILVGLIFFILILSSFIFGKKENNFPLWFVILEFPIFLVIGMLQKKEFKNVVDFVVVENNQNLNVYNNGKSYLIPYKDIKKLTCNIFSKNKFIIVEYHNEKSDLNSPFKIMTEYSIPFLEPKIFKLLKEKIELK